MPETVIAADCGTYFFGLPAAPCPLPLDRISRQVLAAGEVSVFSTASAFNRFLDVYSAAVSGSGQFAQRWSWLPYSRREKQFDVTLDRECAWHGGLMTSLADHHFTETSETALGIAGIVGSGFGISDIVHKYSFYCVVNGLAGSEVEMAELRKMICRGLASELRSAWSIDVRR